ncbi:paraneoplastic antigen-like protein 5 isoform X1 [Mus musculus]|jgi:hypothetical protein|uniref:Paraneoplastic antigen-like protein 5 n=2 Tax=Mus musculus TaxID=10090 RepID=PNMA5_MOUSE|nr:paraneoplastic antigen-like protein 5 [Mus musculus]XP_011245927.1 paraneoplastic antigen-like protein 5 isoform X1 [Mus musculus]XP_011245928.1 paraneoplastic antigen-like protein 5 isoform X1 [Mus musculus]Q5DTT8.2 RecName: Full=Paraneoplastic antigen-like protein 5 [Mus musculus]EDL26553.1 mCG58254 [Mus musculus]|eukprot:NP_001093931.1 paraneoplastic antigen-like protein 5 [Mus musculus]
MAVALLDDWCKGMDLDPKKAVLIVGIPVQYTEAAINDALKEGLPPLCAYKVIGRMFRREDEAKAVLIELPEVVDYTMMPTHIPAEGGAWEVVVKPRSPDDEFMNKLIYFLRDEGRRIVDVAKALGFSTVPTGKIELKNLDQDKPKGLKSLCNNSTCYKKLKVFSGSPFPGPGEESFETWLEEVTELMQLWQVSEREKKQCLLESLRGSALSIMQALWTSNDSLTVEQCLKALKHIFGNKEDSKVLQFRFLQSSQKPAEKVSDYLLRLEPLLQKAVQQSPLSAHSADSIRLKHVLSQVSMTTGLRGKLSLLDQQGCPPTFLELMKLTRDEEEWESTVVVEEQEQVRRDSSACEAANEVVTQAEDSREVSTQTTGEEMTSVKRRRLLWRHSAGEEGQRKESGFWAESEPDEQKPYVRAQESGNERGAWAVSHPNPKEIEAQDSQEFLPVAGNRDTLTKSWGSPDKGTGDMSVAEGQQGQGKAPNFLLARNDPNKQEQIPHSSVTTKWQDRGECQRLKWGASMITRPQGNPDRSWDTSGSQDGEDGCSELRMPTGTEAAQGVEEPATGLSWAEDTSAWEQARLGRETVPRRGGRRIQPVFRIIYTALGEPHEGSTLESFRE